MKALKQPKPLKVLITAGPTREMLDPVRFLSNVSTGEMGYAFARHCAQAGQSVTLVSGPTALKPPRGVNFVPIVSAAELKKVCEKKFPSHDVLVMVAAVCDFTPAQAGRHKIRRTKTKKLVLQQTPDIVAGLGRNKAHRKVIGFCLETENWILNAKAKLARKNLDGIVANYYTAKHSPFGARKINTAFISADGRVRRLRNQSKKQISSALYSWIISLEKKTISQ